MNNEQETLILEWSNLAAHEADIRTADFKQDNTEENILSKEAALIITGVKNDIRESNMDFENSTIDFKNNEKEERQNVTSSFLTPKQLKQTELKKSLEIILNHKKPLKESTFYKHIESYNGTVQSVDEKTDSFTAHLINSEKNDDELIGKFSLEALSFPSDKELIREGSPFVWLIGKEIEHGTETNISKFIFRRTPVIQERKLQEVKTDAQKWEELFSRIGDTETAGE